MKAILVIDLIDNYNLDDLRANVEVSFKDDNQLLCILFREELKPIPKKKGDVILTERSQDIKMVEWQYKANLIATGWNECLNKILGGNNETD